MLEFIVGPIVIVFDEMVIEASRGRADKHNTLKHLIKNALLEVRR